jgi:hypothetical protein
MRVILRAAAGQPGAHTGQRKRRPVLLAVETAQANRPQNPQYLLWLANVGAAEPGTSAGRSNTVRD